MTTFASFVYWAYWAACCLLILAVHIWPKSAFLIWCRALMTSIVAFTLVAAAMAIAWLLEHAAP